MSSVLYAVEKKYSILFDIGSHAIPAQGIAQIDSLVYNEILYPGIKLSLVGYADYIGDTASNMLLSQRRAENVKAYLISMGFKDTDLKAVQWKGEITAADTNSKDGIPKDRRVDIVIEKPLESGAKKEFVNDFSKLKVNSIVRLNIFFFEMTHRYRDESEKELESLYKFLKKHETIKVRIEGHICCGNWDRPKEDGYDLDTKTQKLSLNRAKAVYEYLIKKGISPEQMSYIGFAFTNPLYSEKNQWEKDQNKRVEVRIVSK